MSLLADPLVRVSQAPKPKENPDIAEKQRAPAVVKKVMVEPDGGASFLAVSPDGGTIAAGCADGSIRLLGALSGEIRMTLADMKQRRVLAIAFVPGSNTSAALSGDNQLHLWDLASGKLLAIPALATDKGELPPQRARSFAVSADGGLVAFGTAGTVDNSGIICLDENTFFKLRVRNTKTGELIWSHVGRRGFMHESLSPDGTTLASDTSGDVRLWDARTWAPKRILKPGFGSLWSIVFSPDSRLLARLRGAMAQKAEEVMDPMCSLGELFIRGCR